MDPNLTPQVQQPTIPVQDAPSSMSASTPVQTPTQQDTPDALAQPMVQVVSDLSTQPQEPQTPSRAKETGPATSNELAGYVEVVGGDALEKEPLPPEVSSWMEKVSRDTSGEKPPEIVLADTSTPPMVDPLSAKQTYVLPLGEDQMKQGMNQGVSSSVRWLAEWCRRLVKKLGDQTSYQ